MAWSTPVTNRASGLARMTYVDMNRITQNINEVRALIAVLGYTVPGSDVSKTSWTRDDIVTPSDWSDILSSLDNACDAIGYSPGVVPDSRMLYSNINTVEAITLYLYLFATTEYLTNENDVVITNEDDEFIYVEN